MDILVLGVEIRKNVCGVAGLDASGAVVIRLLRASSEWRLAAASFIWVACWRGGDCREPVSGCATIAIEMENGYETRSAAGAG
jgi:hypothetical protein